MPYRICLLFAVVSAALLSVAAGQTPGASSANDETETQAVRQVSERLATAFNRGEVDAIKALLLPEAELVDDAGRVHKGHAEIGPLLTQYFERFPQAKMRLSVESIRLVGPVLAMEDGTRTISAGDGSQAAERYMHTYVKRNGQWLIASVREFADEEAATPNERLQPLAWLVGDWVDEGTDAVVAISCRWSEDGNFLLISYESKIAGASAMKSTRRIGWDPLGRRIRSWVFDSDGGYGEAFWTKVGDAWIIKSTAVMPDGTTGSATLVVAPQGKDKFILKGLDRIIGEEVQPDVEMTIVRKPPEPAK